MHACLRMSARMHERPLTSCVVGVLVRAGMATAPSGTGRQGRVSLCGVWGGRTVLGCWGGRARARGGSSESAGRCWVWLVTAPDCVLVLGIGICVQDAATHSILRCPWLCCNTIDSHHQLPASAQLVALNQVFTRALSSALLPHRCRRPQEQALQQQTASARLGVDNWR